MFVFLGSYVLVRSQTLVLQSMGVKASSQNVPLSCSVVSCLQDTIDCHVIDVLHYRWLAVPIRCKYVHIYYAKDCHTSLQTLFLGRRPGK